MVTKAAKPSRFLSLGEDVIIDIFDAPTMKLLWSKAYPKESPRAWIAARKHTISLVWDAIDAAVQDEMKSDPVLQKQITSLKEKQGDYLVKVLDARNGNELGKLLIETGKGSFRLKDVYADGDWVLVADSENRVLLYSLKTGELKGRVFGEYAAISPDGRFLCVANEDGKLNFYSLPSMQSVEQFVFTSSVSLLSFSEDGKKLIVLTSNQTAHVFDISSL